MYNFSKTENLDIPLEVAYQVAADIERYHEFIHGMKPVDVLTRGDNDIIVTFNSRLLGGRVQMTAQFEENSSIHFQQECGPFRKFSGHWIFSRDNGKTSVTFAMAMKHKNLIIDKTLQALGGRLCKQVIKDFKKRARALQLMLPLVNDIIG